MSNRVRPIPTDRARDETRQLHDRVTRLERGGAVKGRISLSTSILLGGIEVEVIDDGFGAKTLRFRNPDNGATHEINL